MCPFLTPQLNSMLVWKDTLMTNTTTSYLVVCYHILQPTHSTSASSYLTRKPTNIGPAEASPNSTEASTEPSSVGTHALPNYELSDTSQLHTYTTEELLSLCRRSGNLSRRARKKLLRRGIWKPLHWGSGQSPTILSNQVLSSMDNISPIPFRITPRPHTPKTQRTINFPVLRSLTKSHLLPERSKVIQCALVNVNFFYIMSSHASLISVSSLKLGFVKMTPLTLSLSLNYSLQVIHSSTCQEKANIEVEALEYF